MGPITGGGRGFCAVSPGVTGSDIDFLKNDLHSMRERLAQIEARIENLKIIQKKVHERSER